MEQQDDLFRPSSVELVGPFETHDVVVNGFKVPYLSASPMRGGMVNLVLDNRMALDVSVQDLDRVVAFIADCIAVGMGYQAHPDHGMERPIERHPFQRMIPLNLISD
jgi:hypothetical protein